LILNQISSSCQRSSRSGTRGAIFRRKNARTQPLHAFC